MRTFPILWLTGNMGAGKTTLAKGIEEYYNEGVDFSSPFARRVIVLDGNEMRASISLDETLSAEDRRRHNLRVARLALVLQSHGFLVVVAVIAPFESVRSEVDALCHPQWIHIARTLPFAEDRPYEDPVSPHLTINNDQFSIEQSREQCIVWMEESFAGQN